MTEQGGNIQRTFDTIHVHSNRQSIQILSKIMMRYFVDIYLF